MLALQKQNYRDNEAWSAWWDVDMSTRPTWVLSWLTLPQRNVNWFTAPLHSAAADRAYVVCVAWDRLEIRDNHDDRFASLFICRVSQLALYPLPHSPRRVLPSMTAPRSSDGYHVDGAAYWSIQYRVSRPKKISPDTDTTQYMQVSPNTQ